VVITCQDLYQAIPQALTDDSPLCNNNWRKPFRGICGCPPIKNNACTNTCPGGIQYPGVELTLVKEKFGLKFVPTCADFELIVFDVKETSAICLGAKSYAYLCGCNDGIRYYLGATTISQQAVLAWIPRVTGFLSLMGSLLIIYDVTTNPRRRQSFYHQWFPGMDSIDSSGTQIRTRY
jgi:hypothetical protein